MCVSERKLTSHFHLLTLKLLYAVQNSKAGVILSYIFEPGADYQEEEEEVVAQGCFYSVMPPFQQVLRLFFTFLSR